MPACQRCISRDVRCEYSAKRPYVREPKPRVEPAFDTTSSPKDLLSEIAVASKDVDIDKSLFEFFQTIDYQQDGYGFDPSVDFSTSISSSPSQVATQKYSSLRDKSHLVQVGIVKAYVKQIGAWMHEWAIKSHCPFIHRQLYAETGLPGCLQDAFACLTCYAAKNDDNEEYVWQTIESKANAFFEKHQSNLLLTPPSVCEMVSLGSNSILDLLSKTQAGIIYLNLRLFDGDIRQRAQAERHIPTLTDWLKQLMHIAQRSQHLNIVDEITMAEGLWRDWVLHESVRRSGMTGAYLQTIYKMLRDNEATCSGKVHCTMRQGLWDATTAVEWFRNISGQDPLFWQPDPAELLFSRVKPEEVDRFVHATISIM